MHASESVPFLIARVGDALWALPIAHVIEALRPLEIEPFSDEESPFAGRSVIRGEAIPVLRVATGASPARVVVVRLGARRAALLVDAVVGVRSLRSAELASLPQNAALDRVARVDPLLAGVLASARVVPETAG